MNKNIIVTLSLLMLTACQARVTASTSSEQFDVEARPQRKAVAVANGHYEVINTNLYTMIDTNVRIMQYSMNASLHIFEDKKRGVVCYLAAQSISCIKVN